MSRAAVRIHSSSRGRNVEDFKPGEDLVLEVDEAHGEELPQGVGVRDHLDLATRKDVDVLARDALALWRTNWDAALTVGGVCWPLVWEFEMFQSLFVPAVADAVGLDRALADCGCAAIELADDEPRTAAIALAVAVRRELHVRQSNGGGVPRPPGVTVRRPESAGRRLRRGAMRALTALGIPSRLRSGSVLFLSYWPLMPLLDAMLADRRYRPAIVLDARPSGPRRSLRAAARGGWTGWPGPLARHRAHHRAAAVLARPDGRSVPLIVGGIDLGPCLHRLTFEFAAGRLARDLAVARTFHRALSRGRIRRVVVPFDTKPGARLLVLMAREAGVGTLVVQHGAYFLPSAMSDMTLADDAAIWSAAVGGGIDTFRSVSSVGYPMPHAPLPKPRPRTAARPRVIVLPQPWHPGSSILDKRVVMRHYTAALDAITGALPDAEVVIRPHPADPLAPVARLRERYPRLEVDVRSEITDLLGTGDVCIGGTSTATLQAALVGTPVLILNISGYEWRWPLGGATPVPIARNREELEQWLERWGRGEPIPGREELLAALGADGGDPTERLLGLLEIPSVAEERATLALEAGRS